MKKSIITVLVALLATMGVNAQQIAVVSEGGTTTLFQTLDEAVTGASSGSVIYLPGGGFQIKDETKINKRLTIMGVSHKADAENADGGTTIGGNLWFEEGSDGSAVMGVYLTGDVNIGNETDSVQNMIVRYCNINSVQVKRAGCSGITVNQCYIRSNSNMADNNAKFTNNIMHSVQCVNSGVINHNVVTSTCRVYEYEYYSRYEYKAFAKVHNSTISNNILLDPGDGLHSGSGCIVTNNMLCNRSWGDECFNITDWAEVFVGSINGVSITSNFHLKSDAPGVGKATDHTDVGIYGGTSFNDDCLAPIPRIVSKVIPEQTDASGKLKIQVTVKAN